MQTINTISHGGLTWENVVGTSETELAYLHQKYQLLLSDLRECPPPLQRAKLVQREHYFFMILQFPWYDRASREIKSAEVDFFVSSDFLVTVHSNELDPLKQIVDSCRSDHHLQHMLIHDSPALILHEILNQLLLAIPPMLNHIALDIDSVTGSIFEYPPKKSTIKDILILKRNIVNFKKIMQRHKRVIQKAIPASQRFMHEGRLVAYFHNLIEHTKEIWDNLEHYQGIINALHETHDSLFSFRLNSIIKTLTIFSVILLPLTLLASIFGMNAEGMPFVGRPNGFWIILGSMLVGTVIMFSYFKWKKWI